MIYGSICSGIEAASIAWAGLGWQAKWFSEIDPFCCAVLNKRWPAVPNIGDMTQIGEQHGQVNLVVGGTPCQSFSVNGLRKGLDDPRGDLAIHFLRIVSAVRARWFVYENVPGILTAEHGKAFGTYLSRVEELGFSCGWRVLDSRHFGVPQRRRRVFVVGHRGGSLAKVAAVLFDSGRNQQDARPTGQVREVHSRACPGGPVVGWTGDATPKFASGVSPTLRSQQGGEGAGFMEGGKAYRFTAREWERLQGFPDDHTLVEFNGSPASESRRMKAIGNSFPVPVLHWLGQRIKHTEEL